MWEGEVRLWERESFVLAWRSRSGLRGIPNGKSADRELDSSVKRRENRSSGTGDVGLVVGRR